MPSQIPTPTCEWADYGYPHEGCAEFGPPDEFHCTDPARLVVSWSAPYGDSVMFVCATHGLEMLAVGGDDYITITDVRAVSESDVHLHAAGVFDAATVELTDGEAYGYALGYTDAPDDHPAFVRGWGEMITVRYAAVIERAMDEVPA